jgi:chromate transport protein ChrA
MTTRSLPWRADPVAGQLAGWMVLFFPAALIMGVVAWLLMRSSRRRPSRHGS